MRNRAKSKTSWVREVWAVLAALPLLALTNCTLARLDPNIVFRNLNRGSNPHSSAVFCDIENSDAGKLRRCATAEDKAMGIRLAAAAVALNTGQTSEIGLDESPEARARCNGEPEAVFFRGAFPEGLPVCLNCNVIGPPPADYATPTAMCGVQCLDVSGQFDGSPVDQAVRDICALSRASTNWASIGTCALNACPTGDTLSPTFADPRRLPEPVAWVDMIGASAAGNSITKIAGAAGVFDAGGVSLQWITRGDAYVEFSPSENNRSHIIGFSVIPAACPAPCTDTDPGFQSVGFAISLNVDGRFYVIESGVLAMGPDMNGSFGLYGADERFRVSLHDNSDGTASVTYSRITGTCNPGAPCNEVVFFTRSGGPAQYPLRIDTSFREPDATLANVNVVRIQ
jgi:hypothetical protein